MARRDSCFRCRSSSECRATTDERSARVRAGVRPSRKRDVAGCVPAARRRATTRAAQLPRTPGTSWPPHVVKCTLPRARAAGTYARDHVHLRHAEDARVAAHPHSSARSMRDNVRAHGREAVGATGTPRRYDGTSVTDEREEAARHRVHDAHAALDAARQAARRRRSRPMDHGARGAESAAMTRPWARPQGVPRNPAQAAPVGGEKNGRRPHRCLQSDRESALRRPQTLDHEVRRRSTRKRR